MSVKMAVRSAFPNKYFVLVFVLMGFVVKVFVFVPKIFASRGKK